MLSPVKELALSFCQKSVFIVSYIILCCNKQRTTWLFAIVVSLKVTRWLFLYVNVRELEGSWYKEINDSKVQKAVINQSIGLRLLLVHCKPNNLLSLN